MKSEYDVYRFVIDTEQYAGNFERQMTAYMTGRVGECNVGDAEAVIYHRDLGIEVPEGQVLSVGGLDDSWDFVINEADEHGCARPCKIYPTPGWYNNGYGKHFRGDADAVGNYPAYFSVAISMERAPTEEEMDKLMARAKAFVVHWKSSHPTYGEEITITSFRLVGEKTVTTTIVKHSWA